MINLDKLKEMDNWFSESICKLCHELKYKCSCESKCCGDCEFSKLKNCIDFLKKDYKKNIYLTQFEYDLLKVYADTYNKLNSKIVDIHLFKRLQKNIYYNGVTLNMTFKEALDRAIIIADRGDEK